MLQLLGRIADVAHEAGRSIELGQLEEGDHLLRFGTDGVRYCHAFSEEEEEALSRTPGLSVVDRYLAEEGLNRYYILRVGP